MKAPRDSLSVCRATGIALQSACAARGLSMSSVVTQLAEDVLAMSTDDQAAFVERVRQRMHDVWPKQHDAPLVVLTLPVWINDTTQPRPSGRCVLADVPVPVDEGTASIVDDLVTREHELRGRDVSRQSIFEPALIAALNAAEAGAR